jgi:TonB family protein
METPPVPPEDPTMHPTLHLSLPESDRSPLRAAECASMSFLAHAALFCLAIGVTAGGTYLPTDEREARVFFTLPPDHKDAPLRQDEAIQWPYMGGALEDGGWMTGQGDGASAAAPGYATPRTGKRSQARGDVPFGPPARLGDTAFTMFEVDLMVERFESSAGPVYPPELIATGTEGQVHALYVVDSTGRADTTSIRILRSDDPRFTESVRAALGDMSFRPAKRHGKAVRQLVEQRFRFQLGPTQQMATHQS